jgi:hypothetical protein
MEKKNYSEELHDLSFSSNISGTGFHSGRQTWHVARMGENRNAYRILVGKFGGERPLKRSKHRWNNNIKMDLKSKL